MVKDIHPTEVGTPKRNSRWKGNVETHFIIIREQFPMLGHVPGPDGANDAAVYVVDETTLDGTFLVTSETPTLNVWPHYHGVDQSLWDLGFEEDFPQEFRPTLLPVIQAFDAVGAKAAFSTDVQKYGRIRLSLFVECDDDVTQIYTYVTPDIEYELPALVNQWTAYADEMVP